MGSQAGDVEEKSVFSYLILGQRVLGRGAGATVYRGVVCCNGAPIGDCAIKVISPDRTDKDFDEEVAVHQEVTSLNHRNLLSLIAVERREPDRQARIITEIIEGIRPEVYMQEGEQTPRARMERALELSIQVCDGLAAIHSINLLHRDIKPENMLVRRMPDGSILLTILDFGISRPIKKCTMNDEGTVFGTPSYMSPEQARGWSLDVRSDIFSAGVFLCEMATGERLITAKTAKAAMLEVVSDDMTGKPGIAVLDSRLRAILTRMLAQDRTRRYDSANDAAEAMRHLLAELREPVIAPSPARSAAALSIPDHTAMITPEQAVAPARAVSPDDRPRFSIAPSVLAFMLAFSCAAMTIALIAIYTPPPTHSSASAPASPSAPPTLPAVPQQARPVITAPAGQPSELQRCEIPRSGHGRPMPLYIGDIRVPDPARWDRVPAHRRERQCAHLRRQSQGHGICFTAYCTNH